jgi:hypothetical protein
MKANELMIGDWVFAVDCARPNAYRVTKVNAQPENGEYPIHIDRPADGLPYTFLDFDQVAPIPLTGEILERNGFGKVLDEYGMERYRYFNNAGDCYIKISLYDRGARDWIVEIVNYDKFNDNKIDYKNRSVFLKVHELQHALKLCGIDKDIVL